MVAYKLQLDAGDRRQPTGTDLPAGRPAGPAPLPVTRTLTVETGSASARAYIYEGTTFIGFFFPSKAPYTLTFSTLS